MNPAAPPASSFSRRHWLSSTAKGLGGIALAELLSRHSTGAAEPVVLPHFAPKAKRVIFLFMSGGMSQFESFDHKPFLAKNTGEELPDSYKQRGLLGMSNSQARFPLVRSFSEFRQHGRSGAWVSDLFPHTARVADDLCFIKSLHTDAVNHDPAMIYMVSGEQFPGRPSMGSWITYGLGSENADLPSFIVLVTKRPADQPLSSRLWDNGFLPSQYQGTQFRASNDPVLYLSSPGGIDGTVNRATLDGLRRLHELKHRQRGEPEIESRIAQFEMAGRMQSSVPAVTDLSGEPESVRKLYGPDVDRPGSFARNCLLARRLAESGVRYVQLYHPNWDAHGQLPKMMGEAAGEVDQGSSALIQDLKNRDMLKDTLVIFGTEFGRTPYSQGPIVSMGNYGREHHRNCCTFWMAGGGVKPGHSHGETCEIGYDIVSDPVHVHDFHATVMHLLGIDHERFTYFFKGRNFRLTDVHGKVVKPILA